MVVAAPVELGLGRLWGGFITDVLRGGRQGGGGGGLAAGDVGGAVGPQRLWSDRGRTCGTLPTGSHVRAARPGRYTVFVDKQ
jgi:hypothetical protein